MIYSTRICVAQNHLPELFLLKPALFLIKCMGTTNSHRKGCMSGFFGSQGVRHFGYMIRNWAAVDLIINRQELNCHGSFVQTVSEL